MRGPRILGGEETYPLVLGNLFYTGDRRVFGFFVKARNVPGVLAGIAGAFAELRVNILSIYFNPVPSEGEVGTGFIVGDFTGLSLDPEVLRSRLEKVRGVVEVRVVQPQHRGVLLDPYHFPIVGLGGERYILTGETGMKGNVEELRRRLGPSASSSFLYYQGVARGKYVYELLRSLGAESPAEYLNLLLLHAHQRGRYRGRIVEYSYRGGSRDRIVVRVEDNWECMTAKQLGIRGPSSHLERGVIAGVLHEATGRTVRVVETKCIARGDPYCEFKITFHG